MQGREHVDQTLQTAMLRDAFDYNGDSGIVVLLMEMVAASSTG